MHTLHSLLFLSVLSRTNADMCPLLKSGYQGDSVTSGCCVDDQGVALGVTVLPTVHDTDHVTIIDVFYPKGSDKDLFPEFIVNNYHKQGTWPTALRDGVESCEVYTDVTTGHCHCLLTFSNTAAAIEIQGGFYNNGTGAISMFLNNQIPYSAVGPRFASLGNGNFKFFDLSTQSSYSDKVITHTIYDTTGAYSTWYQGQSTGYWASLGLDAIKPGHTCNAAAVIKEGDNVAAASTISFPT